jgi:hypothetical protein
MRYTVTVASYCTVVVDAIDEDSACETAMEIFEPSGEWVIAECEQQEDSK